MLVRYARTLTARRLLNAAACRVSYMLAALGLPPRFKHHPEFIALEPADYCMLRCRECPVGRREQNDVSAGRHTMPPELYKRLIDEVAPYTHTIILHFQGEPLLSPYLSDMVAYAHQRRLYTMLSTNAQTLTEERAQALAKAGLDKIIISVDGLTQEVYAQYREGGSLEKALSGIKVMAQIPYKKRPEIVMQCLMLRQNEHQWADIRKQYRTLGADRLEMKTAQLYDYEHGSPDMPSDNRYSRYKKGANGLYQPKQRQHNRCFRLWSGCVVTATGEVRPCCYAKDGTFAFGNMSEARSLQDILLGKKAQLFRKNVFSQRKGINICRNCVE